MNIFEKMAAVTKEISSVAKNLKVGEGRSAYKAVGEADVLAAVRPAEEKAGIYSYPYDREIVESAVLTSTSEYNGNKKETNKQFMRIRTVYRFVNIEKPAEHIDIVTYGDGVDTQDKAPGKAMTYADKYALLKAYKIITGDDPDQNYSEEFSSKANKTPMASEKQIAFLKKLGNDNPKNAAYIKERVKAWDQLTMHDATEIIGALKNGS